MTMEHASDSFLFSVDISVVVCCEFLTREIDSAICGATVFVFC